MGKFRLQINDTTIQHIIIMYNISYEIVYIYMIFLTYILQYISNIMIYNLKKKNNTP